MSIPQIGSQNLNAPTVLCDAYNGINSITPLELAPSTQAGAAAITWALDTLGNVGLHNTILGCPTKGLSPLYPKSKKKGGPLNPPPSVVSNAGNNVYNKVYFTSAPTKPQCQHSS